MCYNMRVQSESTRYINNCGSKTMKKKADVIVCPCCGAEYLPAEIFIPESYIGKPKNIVKDEFGKIFTFDGESMNTYERYQCDYCGNTFKVFAKTTFFQAIPQKYLHI